MKSKMALGIGLLLLTPAVMTAEPSAHTEYEIKAAFLYNFAKFVEMAAVENGTHADGREFRHWNLWAKTPSDRALDRALDGKTIQGMPIVLGESPRLLRPPALSGVLFYQARPARTTSQSDFCPPPRESADFDGERHGPVRSARRHGGI